MDGGYVGDQVDRNGMRWPLLVYLVYARTYPVRELIRKIPSRKKK